MYTRKMSYRKPLVVLTIALLCLSLVAVPASQAKSLYQEEPPNSGADQLTEELFIPFLASPGADVRHASVTGQVVNEFPLRLKALTIGAGQDVLAALPAELTIAGYAQNQAGYYIVQLRGPVEQAMKDQIAAAGADLLTYLPDFAFKARMTPAVAEQVAQLASVGGVYLFQPAFKLNPDLKRNGPGLYTIRVERGVDSGPVADAIARVGAQILHHNGELLIVAAEANLLNTLAQVLDVAWIDNYVPFEKHNEFGAGVIVGANTANNNGYDGSSQIAAVADSGLGDGNANTSKSGIPTSRIISINNWPGAATGCFASVTDDGPQDVDSGHGSHVATSVLGDGGSSGLGKGAAPAARLVFQATENWATTTFICQVLGGWPAADYFLTGLPDDLNNLFQQAYSAGARIHANSWGAAVAGDYTASSAQTDQFTWNNPAMAITFSAGNAGADANNDGVVDNDSIGAPATAKNVITVGASENDRADNWPCDTGLTYTSRDSYQSGQTCNSMGGQNILGTAGERWGFNAEPLNSDQSAGNAQQMAPFSSRGPTDDGRIKPDVVAPGTWILSGYSELHQEQYDGDPVNPQNNAHQWDGWGMPINKFYKYMGGTSMSNPIAAGAATVVRDFYRKAVTHEASGALVKATLINSAVDLQDENNDGANDNDFPIPNVHEGWGRVDLVRATDGSHQYVDESAGLNTNGSAVRQFNIGTGGAPFKVTLVWTDFPSTESAAQNLVNNLDLIVTAPNGSTTYLGNNFSGGWSQAGGSADSVNNVENVYVQSAAAGSWTVEVRGVNVPNGPQPYALVVDGNFGSGPTPTPTDTPVPPTDTPVPPTPTNTPVGPTPTPTDTPAPPTPTNTPVGPTPTPTDTPAPPTPTDTPVPPTPTPTPGTGSMHVGDLDGTSASQGFFGWGAQVTITIHDANEDPVANATVNGTWSSGFFGSSSCTTNSSGQCTVERNIISNGDPNISYAVNSVSHGSLSYQAADNHDPDGDSNGSQITVARP